MVEIDISIGEYIILRDLVEMLSGVNRYTSVNVDVSVDGWHGKGEASYNKHEPKIHIRLEATNEGRA